MSQIPQSSMGKLPKHALNNPWRHTESTIGVLIKSFCGALRGAVSSGWGSMTAPSRTGKIISNPTFITVGGLS